VVLLDDPVELLDAQGNPVRVTARGMFTAEPARLAGAGVHRGALGWWTGPWPVDERWWDSPGDNDSDRGPGRTARAQVLIDGDPPQALLLCYRRRRWYVEGAYE
jgi:protein ImuB